MNVQVNSATGPLQQLNAPAAICIVFWPGTAGELTYWKVILVLPFVKEKASAGIPFTVKSLAWTVAGSTGQLRSILKTVGGVKKVVPQGGLVTEQGEEVGVGVAVGVDVAVAVGVDVGLDVGVGVGVPPPPGDWIPTVMGDPILKKPTVALALCGG
jgi:hypothetical protein